MGQSSSKDVQLAFDKDNIPHFKVALIGEPYVGKSSILLRYAKNQYKEDYLPTRRAIVENVVKKVNMPSQSVHSVTLWDLPGREDIDLRESYYRNVDAAIVVVDMTDPESIELAPSWKQDFLNKVSRTRQVTENQSNGVLSHRVEYLPCDPETIPVLLLGNKYDLVEEKLREEEMKMALMESEEREKEKNVDETSSIDMKSSVDDDDMEVPKLDEELRDQIDGAREETKQTEEDNEEDELGEARTLPAQKGPKKNEKKPECVQHLERVEEEHGFVGSVMVSARDPDGSVHAAIQSLVRHMLDKVLPERPRRQEAKVIKKEVEVVEEPKLFETTGIQELDGLFERCETPLRRARDYLDYYELMLKKLKQTCANHGYLSETKVSLEDCIIGIRDALRQATSLELLAKDDDTFLLLDHQIDHRVKIPKHIPYTLNQFNTEYVPLCKAVMRDCPVFDVVLTKLEKKVTQKCESISVLVQGTDLNVQQVTNVCDKNRAKIIFAKTLNKECLNNVENAKEKVKMALMW